MNQKFQKFIDPKNTDYLNFGDLVRSELQMQCQYASAYVKNDIGKGLRFLGTPADYHFLRIHKDDADTFIQRVHAYWDKIGKISLPR